MKDSAIEMAKRLLVDSIWKSANLEGLGTTFPKTEAILANAPTTTKTEEVLFIINMKRAWQFLLDNLDFDNCIMLLREYNKIVGELLFSYAGEVRTIPVQIGGTSWEPEIPQTGIIIETIQEIEKINDIELKALKYFCYVARTQMFIDGNKRVAQLMANKVLIENNIGIFQIPIEKLEEFKGMLIEFYETEIDDEIIRFMKEYCIKRIPDEG
ncbi:Fic family protein [Hungatella hathewayi]|uniref:Fic family protein n=1 Tax=Hungatella hathewayi TaxID=154046 RepID=UPI003562DEB1